MFLLEKCDTISSLLKKIAFNLYMRDSSTSQHNNVEDDKK
ncbi:hypothetical protein FH5_04908 [Priestia endophytica]|nr:hypothetical protein FH5_04908 [Priestia endophytica]